MWHQRQKEKIQQLQNRLGKLRRLARKLETEREWLARRAAAMDLLVQHQDSVARALHCHIYGGTASLLPTLADDTGLIEPTQHTWPLMEELQSMNLCEFSWVQAATPQDVATTCLDHLQQLALLLNYHKTQPSLAQPLLDRAVSELMHITKALYLCNPRLVYALNDVNLMTGCYEPPPRQHWEAALQAAQPTQEQLQLMQDVLAVVTPKIEQLEQDTQQLADMIHSVKALSLREQITLQAAAGTAAPASAAVQNGSTTPAAGCHAALLQDDAAAAAGAAAAPAAAAAAAAAEASTSLSSAGSSSATGSSSSTLQVCKDTIPRIPQTCKDMVNTMDRNLLSWRTLSGARSAVTYVFRSDQLARILLASFPFLPSTGRMCDYVAAAAAAAGAQQQAGALQQQGQGS